MSRISWITAAFVGVVAVADARRNVVDGEKPGLSAALTESLGKIAAPFLDKSEVAALVDLSAPKDDLIRQIDGMQKEIMAECNQEQATFESWLLAKQADLYADQQQLESLLDRQAQLQDEVDQFQGQLIGSQNEQDDLEGQLDQAQAAKAQFESQLQEATDLRTRMRDANLALIQQHRDALQALSDLRALVLDLNTDSNEVFSKLGDVSFLHQDATKVDALIDTVKTELAQTQSEDPQVKAELKQRLLGLIDQIAGGVRESLDLYENQENVQQQKFDNEIRPDLIEMIAQSQAQIDSIQAALAQVLGNIESLSSDLDQTEADLDQTTNQVEALVSLISSVQSEIQSGQDDHSTKQSRCRADLDSLEVVRQFIVSNIEGMTPGDNCHPDSPNCDRCLYDAHCPDGLVCSDQGTCGVKPTTAPPKGPYYQLLPQDSITPWEQGRRVDLGVVPQSSFQLNDFSYVFKYSQKQTANGWSNLFNVLNVGDNWPFPNQAALFLTGNMFEIDVWSETGEYWYRNFHLDNVQLDTWHAVAFVVSSSTKTVTLTVRDGTGKIRSQSYPDFHGTPVKYQETGIWVNGRSYTSLVADFADFRRYDSALNEDEVDTVFNEFFP